MKFAFEYQYTLADVLMRDLCRSSMFVITQLVLSFSLSCGPLLAVLCSVILDGLINHAFRLEEGVVEEGLYIADLELFYSTKQPRNMKIQDNHTGPTSYTVLVVSMDR